LTWDSSGENFLSPSNPSRLWSSSTQFSVEVIREQEMNGDEATGTLEPGSRSVSETQSTTDSTATVRQNVPAGDGAGTDDLSPGRSQPNHDDTGDPGNIDPGHRSSPGPDMSKDEADRMTRANWAARRWMDQATAHILPYRGKRPPTATAALIQERGSRIIDGLLDVADACAYTVRMSA
jgi:hypothetical protein